MQHINVPLQTDVRVPPPTHPGVDVDWDFKIDIVDWKTRNTGLKVSDVVDVDAFKAMFPPSDGETEHDVLFSPTLWSAFMRENLDGPATKNIITLLYQRHDLVPASGSLPHARRAFIPGFGMHSKALDNVTVPAPYKTLHDILADVIACQVVWYLKFLHGRPDVVKRVCAQYGVEGCIWQVWRRASGPNLDFLGALYIISIRRMRVADTWAYFPEVEIRSPRSPC